MASGTMQVSNVNKKLDNNIDESDLRFREYMGVIEKLDNQLKESNPTDIFYIWEI